VGFDVAEAVVLSRDRLNYNNAAPRPPRDEPVYAQPQRPNPIHYAPDTLEPIAAVEDEVDD
jgi:hypothetical protein